MSFVFSRGKQMECHKHTRRREPQRANIDSIDGFGPFKPPLRYRRERVMEAAR